MAIKTISKIMIIVTFIIWIGWDIYAFLFGKDATLSVVITDWSYYSPMWPFVWGVLIGHWLWPARGTGE